MDVLRRNVRYRVYNDYNGTVDPKERFIPVLQYKDSRSTVNLIGDLQVENTPYLKGGFSHKGAESQRNREAKIHFF